MNPDFSASLSFLEWLYPLHPWMLTAISVDKTKITAKTFVQDERSMVRDWLELHKNFNLYYSVNQPIQNAYDKRKLSKTDVASVHFLHVDVDPREGEDVGTEQVRILGQLESYKTPPSCIVFSGGGYNALWRLQNVVAVADESPSAEETIRRAVDVERRNWQFELDFSTPDHCRDVSRILRLPGTINRPNEEKIAKGRTTALARVHYITERMYDLSVFMAVPMVSANVSKSATSSGSQNVERIESLSQLPSVVSTDLRIILAQGHDPRNPQRWSSRSECLHHVLCELHRCGVSREVMLGIITDSRFGISESVLDKGTRVMKYATRQVDRAIDIAESPELCELNDRHAVILSIATSPMVMVEPLESDTRGELVFQSYRGFENRYSNRFVKIGVNKDGNDIRGPLGKWWLTNVRRRTYENVVFAPGEDAPHMYNLFRGYTVDPVPGQNHLEYLDHMRNIICAGNDENYEYLIRWMARVVQTPRTQSETAIILIGDRGSGKTIFVDIFGEIFGRHFQSVSDPKHLTGTFNAHLGEAIFVVAEEAFNPNDKRHDSVLKTLITGKTINVEPKGLNVQKRDNYIHLMMASNNRRVIPAGDKERRYLVLMTPGDKIGDHAYFEVILNQMRVNGGKGHLLHHLLSLDLKDFSVQKVPSTKWLLEQQEHSLPVEIDWMLEKLHSGVWLSGKRWSGPIPKAELYQDYLNYARSLNTAHPMPQRAWTIWLGKELGDLAQSSQLPPGRDPSRPFVWTFKDLESCRTQFAQHRGWRNYDWPVTESDSDIPLTETTDTTQESF